LDQVRKRNYKNQLNVLIEIILGKHSEAYKKLYAVEETAIKLRLSNNLGFSNALPKITKTKTVINDVEFNQCDILVRDVFNKFKGFYLKHYGYYYGSIDDVDYIVNKEADGYIYVRTLTEYIKEIEYKNLSIIKAPDGTEIKDVIKRSKFIEKQPYTALSNNCQHFVNYSVFNAETSLSADEFKRKFKNKLAEYKKGFSKNEKPFNHD